MDHPALIVLAVVALVCGTVVGFLTWPWGAKAKTARASLSDGQVVAITLLSVAGGLSVVAAVCVKLISLVEGVLSGGGGRPLRVGGKARQARRARGVGWSEDVTPSCANLTAVERRVLAEAWLSSAQLEHASIPAFGRLAEDLVMLGAPADLIERSHLAALDEIRHARRCYALASAYAGGAPHRPGEFPELRQQAPHADRTRTEALVHLACVSLIDGAVAEGIAAEVAALAATLAADPIIRATWEMIAVDEARHAELAWSTIEWCRRQAGAAITSAFADAFAALGNRKTPRLPTVLGVSDERLEKLGMVAGPRLEGIAQSVIRSTATRAQRILCAAAA